MTKIYINGTGCVSAQHTLEGIFLNEVKESSSDDLILPVIPPVYKDFISGGMIRRMGSGAKNGVVASTLAIKEAGSPDLDAIITGTGVGCIKDSEIFLTAIIENNEQFLTPTAFIQSTHNTVGGQIALGLGCKAYNFTYVQAGASFESALIDSRLQLLGGDAQNVLVGGVDEKADRTYEHFQLAELIKTSPDSVGATYSEGASFFVLGNAISNTSYAEVADVFMINRLETSELGKVLSDFLVKNNLEIKDISAVVSGKNNDSRDSIYYDALFDIFNDTTPVTHYKHLSGEYNTASAFGFWVGANILREQQIPLSIQLNQKSSGVYRHVLLYNQYQGLDHSFILLSKC